MCGRFALFDSPRKFSSRIGLPAGEPHNFNPNYNHCPGTPIWGLVLKQNRVDFEPLQWGYKPSWAGKDAPKPINARAERLATSGYFKEAFRSYRCLLPANGWYEWKIQDNGERQPFYVSRKDGDLLGLAGVFTLGEDEQLNVAIVTEPARGEMQGIHERMPLMLDRQSCREWLNPANRDQKALRKAVKRIPIEHLQLWPVGARVNAARINEMSLIEPIC